MNRAEGGAPCAALALAALSLLFLATGWRAACPAQARDARADRIRRIDAYIEGEMARARAPGLALAIIGRGQTLYARGYGVAELEHRTPVRPETIFQSGSTGKQYTAMAVMMLAEEGRLGYDRSVAEFLPDAPESWRPITIRRLLNHSSGMARYFEGLDTGRDYSDEELLRLAYRQPLAFRPGEKFSYSNLGYIVLGLLIGRITGKPYGEFLGERIFRPLGMATARVIDEASVDPDRSAGYVLVGSELRKPKRISPTFNRTADGSLYLSLDDVARWDGALYTEALVGAASLEEAWTSGRLDDGSETGYGFGWYLLRVNGRRLIEHKGSWQGFEAMISRYPDDGLTVAMFANLSGAPVDRWTHRVAGMWNPDLAPAQP